MHNQDIQGGPVRKNRLSMAPSARPGTIPPPDESADSLAALRSFVSPENLSVVLQPIVDLSSGETFAHEALVRCDLEAYKNPLDLFDKAVARRCTGRLGRMIREIGVPLCDGPLFINVHPDELKESWLVRPDDPIYEHDHDVYIEITESVPLSHREVCMGVLSEIGARAGIHLVVDDLGAGYSNLMRIADLEPTMVKLDRQLIQGLQHSRRQRQLVSAVVELCNKLGAEVIAEGVETEEEFDAVRLTGVQYAQGYLFARPAFPPKRVTWPPHRLPDEPIASNPTPGRRHRKTKDTSPKIPTAPKAPYELDINVGPVMVDGPSAALRRGKDRDTVPNMKKVAESPGLPHRTSMVSEARERSRSLAGRGSKCAPTVPEMKRARPTPKKRATKPDASSIRAMRKALGSLPEELLTECIEVGRDGAYSSTKPSLGRPPRKSLSNKPANEGRRIAATLPVGDADELARQLDAQTLSWDGQPSLRDKTTVPQMRKATPREEDEVTSGIRAREPGVSAEVSRHLSENVAWGSKEPPKAVSWD